MLHHHRLIVTVVAAFSCSVQAAVVFVDDDNCPGPGSGTERDPFCSIQTAIDNAVDTDKIVVAPGTYFETINFLGKAITLWSSDGPVVTTIDGTGNFHVVQCVSGEGPDTVLDGFTITGGNANGAMSPDNVGGGMFNSGSSATVTNCTFNSNTAVNSGGGMSNAASSPTVTNCTFSENSASVGGGGMSNGGNSSPTVTNCTFRGNTAINGGGMLNIADLASSPTVTNCILWGDSPNEISGGASLTVTYTDVQGGWPGTGNIDTDPLFVDPADGDFRLSAGSPAIDAGNNWGVPQDTTDLDGDGDTRELTPWDLDGNPRFNADPADFDPGCGVPVVVDMGAYEFQFDPVDEVFLGDIDGDGIVGIVDFLSLLANWGPCEPGCCLADLDIDGDVGIIDFMLLLGNWG